MKNAILYILVFFTLTSCVDEKPLVRKHLFYLQIQQKVYPGLHDRVYRIDENSLTIQELQSKGHSVGFSYELIYSKKLSLTEQQMIYKKLLLIRPLEEHYGHSIIDGMVTKFDYIINGDHGSIVLENTAVEEVNELISTLNSVIRSEKYKAYHLFSFVDP